MKTELLDEDLLPGETPVLSKLANLVVSVKQSGLSRFAFGDLMGVVGMAGKEALGGKAHLTNYRIIFKSHGLNRLRGKHSIFLPNINAVSASLLKLKVDTALRRFEFVMWFKKKILAAIDEQRAAFTPERHEQLQQAILAHPEAIGPGLQKWATAEIINQIFLGLRQVGKVVEQMSGMDVTTYLEILQLFEKRSDEE